MSVAAPPSPPHASPSRSHAETAEVCDRTPALATLPAPVQSVVGASSSVLVSGLNFTRNWARWGARWSRHGLIVAAQCARHPLQTAPFIFLRPRIGRLSHHRPRSLRLPAHYVATAAPSTAPRISIVTPSFRQAHLIERTIRSVLEQGYPNLEYIVQDGASDDGTAEILARYGDRLRHWESTPDRGQTDAINRGFRHASGEIMAYLNSDDILLPGALNAVAQYFIEHPDVDAVYGHRVLIDEQDREIGRWIVPPHDDAVLTWADYIPQETLFWRRRAWEKVGGAFDDSFHFAMDWDFILRLRDAGAKFARIPRFIGAFRVHEKQKTSASISDVGISEMTRLRLRTLGYVPESAEVHMQCSRYLLRHLCCHAMYRAGIARY